MSIDRFSFRLLLWIGLLLFCRRHHVIAPPLMSEFGQGRRGSTSHDRGTRRST